jgi:hypothetical protein
MLPMEAHIPHTLAPFFQEYTFDKLDTERDAELIIERTLACGNSAEVRWLFAHYGRNRIVSWVKQMGTRRLPRRHLPFWQLILAIPDSEMAQSQRGAWPY